MLCRLSVRTGEGAWRGDVDDWTALVVLAALSAEPESFPELAVAVRRYFPEHRLFEPGEAAAAGDGPEADRPWCLIDLPGRTVVVGDGFELPDPRGAYEADPEDEAEGFPIVWLDTPADWLFREAGDDWQEVAAVRAAARANAPRCDSRAVLFGRPLLDYLADAVLGAEAADETREPERTREVHGRWLLTARADLGGRTPREFLLADRRRLDIDLQHRSEQWSRQGHAAVPLAPDSTAYRLGGFSITEVVLYFDLVRALLAEAWAQARRAPRPTRVALVERLAAHRDRWLGEPYEGGGDPDTPAELIESARRRLPATSHGPLDDDCPICQAEAEGAFGPGPAFSFFDGHHLELENEFAFSLCETREEWERQQEEFRELSEKMDREDRERAAAGADGDDPLGGSAWRASFVAPDGLFGGDASPRAALLGLGFLLAELVTDVQDRTDDPSLVQRLNGTYARLRTGQDPVAASAAAGEFREALEAVSGEFPDLTAKGADLQSRVDEILRSLR